MELFLQHLQDFQRVAPGVFGVDDAAMPFENTAYIEGPVAAAGLADTSVQTSGG